MSSLVILLVINKNQACSISMDWRELPLMPQTANFCIRVRVGFLFFEFWRVVAIRYPQDNIIENVFFVEHEAFGEGFRTKRTIQTNVKIVTLGFRMAHWS